MCSLHVSVAFTGSVCFQCAAELTVNYTQTVESNTTVVLPCNIHANSQYPKWSGPPAFTLYTSSSTFNPYLSSDKLRRISWADNKHDLVLNPVTRDDEGGYYCFYNAVTWVVQLYVRGMLKSFI